MWKWSHKLIDCCALPVVKFPNQDSTTAITITFNVGFTLRDVEKRKCGQTYLCNLFLNIERSVQRGNEKSSEPIIY